MTFKGRTCLYHRDCPEGLIFTEAQEYRKALLLGWVDAPWETENPDYAPADLKALLSEVPAQEEEKAAESPSEADMPGLKETEGKEVKARPPKSDKPKKPRKKAPGRARKPKTAAKRQGGKVTND